MQCIMKKLCYFGAKLANNMENDIVKLGRYKHYKGKEYEVIGVARHSETLDEFVVYRALYGECDLWVRPLKMFLEDVEIGGENVPRFKYLGNFYDNKRQ